MYNLHNETGPRAGIALHPISPASLAGLPLLPEAPEQPPASPCLPSSKRSRTPSSGPTEAERSVLHKVSFGGLQQGTPTGPVNHVWSCPRALRPTQTAPKLLQHSRSSGSSSSQ